MGHRRELKLESDLGNLYQVERFVEEISDEYYLNDNYYGNILIAVTEAYKNAVIHGNKLNPEKAVHLLFDTVSEGIKISVFDQGEGFNFKDYLDKEKLLTKEELKNKGILLMLTLADEVEYKNKGRVVEMLFRINGLDENITERRGHLLKGYFSPEEKVKTEKHGQEESDQ